MCFSATASFIAGGVLSVAGAAAIRKAKIPSQVAFAAIPLVFGVQQLTEGILWVAMLHPEYDSLRQPATYAFLFFAQVVWPTWVPLSILLLEKEKRRKRIMYLFLGIGLIVSVYLGFRLITTEIRAEAMCYHIFYDFGFPSAITRSFGIMYFLSTVIVALISSVKRMWLLGTLILLSYVASRIFFESYVISVWCFFSAVISVMVFFIVRDLGKYSVKDKP